MGSGGGGTGREGGGHGSISGILHAQTEVIDTVNISAVKTIRQGILAVFIFLPFFLHELL